MNLSYYIMDFDDNLLHLPTTIKLVKDNKLVEVSSSEFSKIRNNKEYTPPNNDYEEAFSNFRDHADFSPFIEDVKIAVDNKRFAPSYKRFLSAVIEGRLFAIITARGHSSDNLKAGIRYIIDNGLSTTEKELMLKNLKEYKSHFNKNINDDMLFENYLDACEYIGVSSPTFLQTVNLKGNARSPEELKRIAIKRFVERMVKHSKKIDGKFDNFSVGYSEDDKKVLAAVESMLSDELSKQFPFIDYRVYDTSNPLIEGGRKIVIVEKKLTIKKDKYLEKFPSKKVKGS